MGERLNIKNLILEPERTPRPLDPARDLQHRDWEEMRKLSRENRNWTWDAGSTLDASLTLLGDHPIVDQDKLQRILEAYEREKNNRQKNSYSKYTSQSAIKLNLTILGNDQQLTPDEHQGLKELFDENLAPYGQGNRMNFAAHAKMLDQPFVVGKTDRELWHEFIEANRTSGSFPRWAVWLTILGEKPDLTSDDWHRMNLLLEHWRDRNWDDFASVAAAMNVLAADEVKIPPGGGVKLVWKKDIRKTETPSQPSRRKF